MSCLGDLSVKEENEIYRSWLENENRHLRLYLWSVQAGLYVREPYVKEVKGKVCKDHQSYIVVDNSYELRCPSTVGGHRALIVASMDRHTYCFLDSKKRRDWCQGERFDNDFRTHNVADTSSLIKDTQNSKKRKNVN